MIPWEEIAHQTLSFGDFWVGLCCTLSGLWLPQCIALWAVNGTVEAELGFVGPPDVSNKVFVCGIFRKESVSKAYSNWSILRLQSVANCPAVREQFKFSPQNALQSRLRYAKIGRTSSGRLLGVVCHRSYYSHSVFKGHSRRLDGAPDASFCRSVTTPCSSNFFLRL